METHALFILRYLMMGCSNIVKILVPKPVQQIEGNGKRPIKVLLPSGLMLSFLTSRKFSEQEAVSELVTLVFSRQIAGFITSLDFEKIQTIARESMGIEAEALLDSIKENFKICEVDKQCIHDASATKIPFTNFDSAIALACAVRDKIDVIVTESEVFIGNPSIKSELSVDESRISILHPKEFVSLYSFEDKELKEFGNLSMPEWDSSKPQEIELLPDKKVCQVVKGWCLESFYVHLATKEHATAEISLWNLTNGTMIRRVAFGNGPVDALVKALQYAVFVADPTCYLPIPIVSEISLKSSTLVSDSPVVAEVVVGSGSKEPVSGRYESTDTVKAVFYAYLVAIFKSKIESTNKTKITSESLKSKYDRGDVNFSQTILHNERLNNLHLEGIHLEGSCVLDSYLESSFFSSHQQNANLRNITINLSKLQGSDFSFADLNNANIIQTELKKAIFYHADLSGSVIRGSNFFKANFSEAKLRAVHFSACHLDEVIFQDSYLNQAILSGLCLAKANFERAHLSQAVFNDAYLKEAILIDADLKQANFVGANLVGANFKGAKIDQTNFSRSNLVGANFVGADFKDVGVDQVDFSIPKFADDKEMRQTTFAFANLSNANLQGLNLTTACFKGATLDNADLSNTDLQGLDFRETSLQGVNLTGARLYGLKLTDVQKSKLTPEQKKELVSSPNSMVTHQGTQKSKDGDDLCNGRH